MKNLYRRYSLDSEKETQGIWVDLGDGMEVKVARLGNPNYRRFFQTLPDNIKRQTRKGFLSEEKAEELMIRAFAETVLLDWRGKGFVDEKGKPLPYSTENAIKVLMELPSFRDDITEIASSQEGFRAIFENESAKNSEGPSNGN